MKKAAERRACSSAFVESASRITSFSAVTLLVTTVHFRSHSPCPACAWHIVLQGCWTNRSEQIFEYLLISKVCGGSQTSHEVSVEPVWPSALAH